MAHSVGNLVSMTCCQCHGNYIIKLEQFDFYCTHLKNLSSNGAVTRLFLKWAMQFLSVLVPYFVLHFGCDLSLQLVMKMTLLVTLLQNLLQLSYQVQVLHQDIAAGEGEGRDPFVFSWIAEEIFQRPLYNPKQTMVEIPLVT